VEKHPLHHVGPGGSGLTKSSLEHLLFKHRVCHPGGRFYGPRASVHHQGGAPQDDGPRRIEPSQHPGLRQQAGRQGMHVSRRDLQTTQPAVNAETQVANTGMLRAHRRRTVSGPGVDCQQHQKPVMM